MSHDHYAPPEARLEVVVQALDGEGFEIDTCLRDGWRILSQNVGTWMSGHLIGGGVFLVATIALGMTLGIVAQAGLELGSTAMALAMLVSFPALVLVAMYGMFRLYLGMYDDAPSALDALAGWSRPGGALLGLGGVLLAQWLFSAVGQSVQVVAVEVGPARDLKLLGVALSVAWLVFVMSRFQFAAYYVADRELGPLRSLQASWEATRGQILQIVLLWMLSVVVIIVGLMVFLVGVVPASVLVSGMWVSAYRQMAHAPGRVAAPGV